MCIQPFCFHDVNSSLSLLSSCFVTCYCYLSSQPLLNSLEEEHKQLAQQPKAMKSWKDSKKKEKISLEKGDLVMNGNKKKSPSPQEEGRGTS